MADCFIGAGKPPQKYQLGALKRACHGPQKVLQQVVACNSVRVRVRAPNHNIVHASLACYLSQHMCDTGRLSAHAVSFTHAKTARQLSGKQCAKSSVQISCAERSPRGPYQRPFIHPASLLVYTCPHTIMRTKNHTHESAMLYICGALAHTHMRSRQEQHRLSWTVTLAGGRPQTVLIHMSACSLSRCDVKKWCHIKAS